MNTQFRNQLEFLSVVSLSRGFIFENLRLCQIVRFQKNTGKVLSYCIGRQVTKYAIETNSNLLFHPICVRSVCMLHVLLSGIIVSWTSNLCTSSVVEKFEVEGVGNRKYNLKSNCGELILIRYGGEREFSVINVYKFCEYEVVQQVRGNNDCIDVYQWFLKFSE